MKKSICIVLMFFSFILNAFSQVKMEKIKYDGWNNCIKLSNGEIEIIATTEVGPRIIRCGFVNDQNMFHEFKDQIGKIGGKKWLSYGGHRLWHAPEGMPRSYYPDNFPVKYDWDGKTLTLTEKTEPTTGVQKIIAVTLDPHENHVKVVHKLINHNLWMIKLAAWSMSVMGLNGRAIIPQEPYIPHSKYLLPARPVVLWYYSNMSDPRITWGREYIQIKQDTSATYANKIGVLNKQGWAAYILNNEVFLVSFPYYKDKTYPDYDCNNESYTAPDFLELETLSPLKKLKPSGGKLTYTENWYLYKAKVGHTDKSIDKDLLPLVHKSGVNERK